MKAERREGRGETRKNQRAAPTSHLSPLASPGCELCSQAGGELLWQDAACRVVLVTDADYPGYCRVIWNAHVKEMTDLGRAERERCMHVVFAVEAVVREIMNPAKVNLASLGNMTPHVHWHVIPRFADDAHFPQPIWGTRERPQQRARPPASAARLAAALAAALAQSP